LVLLRWLVYGSWLVLFTSCLSQPEIPVSALSRFGKGIPLATVEDDRLEEVSGLVASRNNPGMLWVHNDSGNPAEIYLLDSQAAVRAVYVLGPTQRDWEDIAIGPGPEAGQNYLYLGDIGDNFTFYSENYIYRFPEPKWPGTAQPRNGTEAVYLDTIQRIDTLTFVYPDEQWDAEVLLLDPMTKNLYVMTKEMSSIRTYCLPYPQSTDTTIVAEHLLTVPFEGANLLDRLVAGDISADGQELLLKTYQHVTYLVRQDSAQSVAEWVQQAADTLPYLAEPQGEAIGWAADSSGYFTLSESQIGSDLYLYFYPRQSGGN